MIIVPWLYKMLRECLQELYYFCNFSTINLKVFQNKNFGVVVVIKNLKKGNACLKSFTFYHKPYWMLTCFHRTSKRGPTDVGGDTGLSTVHYWRISLQGVRACQRIPEKGSDKMARFSFCFLNTCLSYLKGSEAMCPMRLRIRNSYQETNGHCI